MKRMVVLIIAILCLCFGFCFTGCTKTCDTCGGEGKIACEKCQETGLIECPNCKGQKGMYELCPDCGGEGFFKEKTKEPVACQECHGTGEILSYYQTDPNATKMLGTDIYENTCKYCDGTGQVYYRRIECNTCNEYGNMGHICTICNGEGYTTCPECEGLRLMTCPTCGGAGEIDD